MSKKKEVKKSYEREIIGVVVCFFAVFLAIGTFFDGSVGKLGNIIVKFFFGLFGLTNYLVPIVILILGVSIIMKNRKDNMRIFRLSSLLVLFFAFILFLINYNSLYSDSDGFWDFVQKAYISGVNKEAGGILGGLAMPFVTFFGLAGTYIIFIAAIVVVLLRLTNIRPAMVLTVLKKNFKKVSNKNRQKAKLEENIVNPIKHEVKENIPIEDFKIENQLQMDEKGEIKVAEEKLDKGNELKDKNINDKKEGVPVAEIHINTGSNAEIQNYKFPSPELLEKHKNISSDKYRKELMNTAEKLQKTLNNFGVSARVINVSRGPAVTRYEIAPDVGVKVSKIVSLTDDIALSLAAPSIRMEAPIPGKSAVGIEIPNKGIEPVYFKDVITCPTFKNDKSKISFALGRDTTGSVMLADIAKMPHVLIAGSTGSGKSVCINTIITSILYKAKPNEVKFIMVDPKMVELGVYNGIPHLLIPVVTDPKKAAGALNWAVQEMVNRYNLFAKKNVRDMNSYNKLMEETQPDEKMPQIVIIIDELADLMMVASKEVEDSICRLAQMARAAGMHLVIATQRPSVDVITGLIKTNVPSRIAFAVSSQVDSRTILDMAGAEKLLGKGDMLFYPMGAAKPVRVQGSFVTDKEVESVVSFIKENSDVKYDEDVLEKIQKGVSAPIEDDDADPLLNEVITMVVEAGQASTSLIQRRFKLGYSRSARIIDQMEARGIVSKFEGTKPRQVLISKEEWQELQASKG